MSARRASRVRILAVVALLAAPLSGCLTIGLVLEAKGDLGHQARIKGIQSAWIEGHDLVLQLKVDPTGPADPRDIRFRVPVHRIGDYSYRPGGGDYQDGDLKLEDSRDGCFEAPDRPLPDSRPLAIRTLRTRYEALEPALRTLPTGVHVVALSFDRKPTEGGWEWGDEAPAVRFDRTMTTALVSRPADGSEKHTLISGFTEQSQQQWGLLLLTPLSVAGDVVTLPLQIVAMFLGGC